MACSGGAVSQRRLQRPGYHFQPGLPCAIPFPHSHSHSHQMFGWFDNSQTNQLMFMPRSFATLLNNSWISTDQRNEVIAGAPKDPATNRSTADVYYTVQEVPESPGLWMYRWVVAEEEAAEARKRGRRASVALKKLRAATAFLGTNYACSTPHRTPHNCTALQLQPVLCLERLLQPGPGHLH